MTLVTGIGQSGAKWSRTKGGTPQSPYEWRIDGIDKVAKNINAEFQKMRVKSAAGLVTAANFILTDADIGSPPLVPHLTGHLRSSRFVDLKKKPVSQDPYVVFGYWANYAAAVHEMMQSPSGKPINWSRPGSGPKFFEASIKRNTKRVLSILAMYSRAGI